MNLGMSASMSMPEINVKLVARNIKTGEITQDIERHNRVGKAAILTLIRVINGEFSAADNITLNNNKRFQLYNFIPRYFALGTNVGSNPGVNTTVTVNDTKLLNELPYPRMKLTQRNIIEDRPNAPYIKLTIKHYVPATAYVNEKLGEAGLFTEESGNNLWARITFPPFEKDDITVIDVTWEITIVSIESEDSPYKDVVKDALYNNIRLAFNKINSQTTNRYATMFDDIMQGITIYARRDANQEEVNEIAQKITLDTNNV